MTCTEDPGKPVSSGPNSVPTQPAGQAPVPPPPRGKRTGRAITRRLSE
jgi:hypothetical protein